MLPGSREQSRLPEFPPAWEPEIAQEAESQQNVDGYFFLAADAAMSLEFFLT